MTRRAPGGRALHAAVAIWALALPGTVRAQTDTAASARTSYWGPIPTAADSVTTVFTNRSAPVWEDLLVWPYRVVSLPFTAFRAGFGATVAAADRAHVPQRIGALLGPRSGPFGVLVHVHGGGLPGLGGGLTARYDDFPGPGDHIRASVTSSFRGDHRARLALELPAPHDGATIQIGGGYRVRPNARFFGFGPEAAATDESYYRQQVAWVGAAYQHPLGARLSIEGQGLWSEIGATATDAEAPPLADQFAAALPPGYGRYAGGVSASVALVHDNTTDTGRPGRGGVRRFRTIAYRGLGTARATFATYRAELQQFFTVGYRHHVLAVRAVGAWMSPLDGRPIPFQYLLTNDDPDLFRGYQDFRWRDRGLALMSAEYRWPIWAVEHPDGAGVDLYLLADAGQVFGATSQLSTTNLTVSYGAGIRLLGGGGLTARIEYGRSHEEWILRLRGDQVFQFARNALFYGRDPIPFR